MLQIQATTLIYVALRLLTKDKKVKGIIFKKKGTREIDGVQERTTGGQ